ncbi:MAG: PAS domain S-box protein [Bacteroidetes bacterium]|nr:PAS domain S-box protein [Bacteroidota bacterium]MBL6943337.1 PAS domain S-box protein [Bacteroidales bacterium]
MKEIINILLIEDNPGDLRLISELLKEVKYFNYRLSNCLTLQEGIKQIQKEIPDVILLDLNPPDSKGQQTFEILHSNYPDIPIILVSGMEDEELSLYLIQLGAQDFINKSNIASRIIERSISYSLERNKLRISLQESEEFTKRIIDSSSDCIKVLDLEGNLLSMNDGGQTLLEIDDLNPYLNKSWTDFWKGDYHKAALKAIAKAKKGESAIFTGFSPTEKGTPKWWEIIVSPISNAQGKIYHLLAVSRDITERVKAEEKIKQAAINWQATFNSIDDIVMLLKPDHEIIDINEAGIIAIGKKREEIIGQKCYKLVHNTDAPIKECSCVGSLKTKEKALNVVTQDNSTFELLSWPVLDEKNEIKALTHIVKDITAKKQVADALKNAETKFHTLFDTTTDAIMVLDTVHFLDCNPATLKMFGCATTEEFCSKHPADLSPPFQPDGTDSMTLANQRITTAMETGTNMFEWIHMRADTKETFQAEVILNKMELYGKMVLQATVRDITERKQDEELLRQSELKYKQLFDEDLTGNFIASVDGKILLCNLAMAKIFGFDSVEEIKKINISSLYLPDDSREEFLNLIRKEKRVIEQEQDYILQDGRVVSVIQNVTGEFDENGELIRLKGYMFDNTKRKRAEQIQKILYNISKSVITSNNLEELVNLIRQELGTIVNTSNFYIALYDDKTDTFSLPYLIDEKEDFTSFPAGKSLTNYVRKTQKSILANKETMKEMIKTKDVEMIGTTAEIWLGVPLKIEGKVSGVLAVQSYTNKNAYNESDMEILEFVSDQIGISIDRKKAEQDLIMALEKAQESDRLKSAFLTNMSHEIRTPMNGILGFAQLLKEPDLTGDQQVEYISIIEKSGVRLLSTIHNLMDISMIESGQMKVSISDNDINKQTLDLFSFFKPEVEEKGMSLSLVNLLPAKESIIKTDEDKLDSILTNLIKNAIKYSHKGGIEFGYVLKTDCEPSELEFFVKDTGIGIPKNRQDAIFDLFVQSDIEDKDVYEGNGLGLSISKAYVEILGGKIWVESEVGVGSQFYFTIPYITDKKEITESKEEKVEVKPKHQVKKLKILIAEDEEISDTLLTLVLKDVSNEILHAQTGLETIEIIRNNPNIDLILMDIKMPIVSGYEATRQIRKFNKDVKIIAQTAYALSGDHEKALEAGCDDYITKPIDNELLMEKISNLDYPRN